MVAASIVVIKQNKANKKKKHGEFGGGGGGGRGGIRRLKCEHDHFYKRRYASSVLLGLKGALEYLERT